MALVVGAEIPPSCPDTQSWLTVSHPIYGVCVCSPLATSDNTTSSLVASHIELVVSDSEHAYSYLLPIVYD